MTSLIAEHPDVVDYLGRALVEGDAVGSMIFDGLVRVSAAERDELTEHQLVRPGFDRTWAALNALILRIGAVILRHHIVDRRLPEPFTTATQLRRWDEAVTALIRGGQLRGQHDTLD